MVHQVICLAIALALAPGVRPLRLVYYSPSDLSPLPAAEERIDKVLKNVQAWYSDQMGKCGYGKLTFALDRLAAGKLRIIQAKGELPLSRHGREKEDCEESIHRVVKAAVRTAGLDPEKETVLVFSNLLVWKDNRNYEIGPFYGAGSARSGECWVFDDPLLDPDKLDSKEPGGWYWSGPVSLGKFNTTYIGGIAHELGHAFGLPHERETHEETTMKGVSIMGPGNHHYGEQLRGEGPGAFMTQATAFPLSLHPCFIKNGSSAKVAESRTLVVTDLQVAAAGKGALEILGRAVGTPAIVGLVGYDDPDSSNDDDSQIATTKIATDGKFRLKLPPPVPGRGSGAFSLRLSFYHQDGDPSRRSAEFHRTEEGGAPLSSIVEQLKTPRKWGW